VSSAARGPLPVKILVSIPPLKSCSTRHDGHTGFSPTRARFQAHGLQCRAPRGNSNYLLEEYLIYRVYGLLTSGAPGAARARHVRRCEEQEPARDALGSSSRTTTDGSAQQGRSRAEGRVPIDVDSREMTLVAVSSDMIAYRLAVSPAHIVLIGDSTGSSIRSPTTHWAVSSCALFPTRPEPRTARRQRSIRAFAAGPRSARVASSTRGRGDIRVEPSR